MQNQSTSTGQSTGGCWKLFGIFLAFIWVILVTAGAQVGSWTIDELQFGGAPGTGLRFVRVLVAAGYGVTLLLSFWPLARASKQRSLKTIFRAWSLAGLFALVISPIHLIVITDTQAVMFFQIILGGIFLAGGMAALQRYYPEVDNTWNWGRWWPALLAGGLALVPWVIWGAMGSWEDTLLGLVSGLVFGADAAIILRLSIAGTSHSHISEENDQGLPGLAMVFCLAIMATGFGTVGMKWLMLLSVPAVGWIVTALLKTRQRPGSWLSVALMIGLTAAWPVIFFDADELSSIYGSGPGEIIQWAITAGMVCAVILLVSGLVSRPLTEWIGKDPHPVLVRNIGGAATGLVWIAGVILYLTIGQPGFFGERLFVILKDQADLSGAEQITEIDDRRAFVFHTLADHANAAQVGLRSFLDQYRIGYTPYYLVNAIEINGGRLIRSLVENRPDVDRVLDSPMMRPLPAPLEPSLGDQPAPQELLWNITKIGADRVWSEFEVTGTGIVIGQSDSGVQGDHVELSDSYRGKEEGDDYNWIDPWNHSLSPQDLSGHGTHTLGSALGNHTGVAPDAEWIGCVNLARNLGNPPFYLNCMQFMLAPYPEMGDAFQDGDPARSADVINNSWGCPEFEGCDADSLEPAVQALRAAGIFVTTSAGNEGLFGCGTIDDPIAPYDSSYSVGAVDESGELASFSSLGPSIVDGVVLTKPDISAPGAGILSAYPGSTYNIASGTSMASPHVAGVVALIWSANPDLIGDIDQTERILNQSAQPYSGSIPECVSARKTPNNAVGWGILDAYAAVKLALGQP